MRLALKVVMQNDGDFVDVILLHPRHARLCAPHSQSGSSEERKVACFARVHLKLLYLLKGTWYTRHPIIIKYVFFYNLFKNTTKLEHLGRKRKSTRLGILDNIHLQTDRRVRRVH